MTKEIPASAAKPIESASENDVPEPMGTAPCRNNGPCKNKSALFEDEAARLALSLRRAWLSGSVASIASAVALVACSKAERKPPVTGINAISHWVWGKRAYIRRRWHPPSTLTGYAIHHASSIFWATLFERLSLPSDENSSAVGNAARAGAVTALAYYGDFHVTPARLTPGFQHVISKRSLIGVYVVFAAGLAVTQHMRKK